MTLCVTHLGYDVLIFWAKKSHYCMYYHVSLNGVSSIMLIVRSLSYQHRQNVH